MTLRYYRYEYRVTAVAVTLTECPFCGHEFDEGEHRWKHFLDDHGPEDVPAMRDEAADRREGSA